jgi:hypothetical protein
MNKTSAVRDSIVVFGGERRIETASEFGSHRKTAEKESGKVGVESTARFQRLLNVLANSTVCSEEGVVDERSGLNPELDYGGGWGSVEIDCSQQAL